MKQFGVNFKSNWLQFPEATATLIGTVIGAGVLGIPFAASKIGFLPSVVLLSFLVLMNVILQLMFVEVTLRTKKDHEIPGYGGLYLGHKAKMIALMAGIVGGYGTLLAYIIAQGEILQVLLGPVIGGSPIFWSLLFFSIGGYVIFRGLGAVRIIELIMTIGIFAIVFLIGMTATPHINASHLGLINLEDIIIPYGVFIFAVSGIVVIPQIRQQMRKSEKNLPWVIVTANIAIFIIYYAFMWLVLGVTGARTTEVATVGLGLAIGPIMLILGNVLAFLTISTSFIAIGLAVRRLFQYDYGFSRFKAWLATMIVPLMIFLLGARSFIVVLGVVGGVIIGMQSIIIILAFWRALKRNTRKPEFELGGMKIVGTVLVVIYIIGALFTLLKLL